MASRSRSPKRVDGGRRLLLPNHYARRNVPGQGWSVGTEVKQSRIPGAGHGRFTTEAVKAGTELISMPIVQMVDVQKLSEIPLDHVVAFSSVEDLEKYVLLSKGGGLERDDVLQLFTNFLWSMDATRGYLCLSSWNTNHASELADGLCMKNEVEYHADGTPARLISEAYVDLEKDTELCGDYRKFAMPKFYLEYCAKNGIRDVRTVVMEAIGCDQKQRFFALPNENAQRNIPGQGWCVGTHVRRSRIPCAGNGRFTTEAVKAGTEMCRKGVVQMAHVQRLSEMPLDGVVAFSSADDLEKYVALSAAEGLDRAEVLDLFSHFLWSYDATRGYLCLSSWNTNHADDAADGLCMKNEVTYARDGAPEVVVTTALTDIGKDVELKINYRPFSMPKFYLDYCAENGFRDVRTIVMEAIGAA